MRIPRMAALLVLAAAVLLSCNGEQPAPVDAPAGNLPLMPAGNKHLSLFPGFDSQPWLNPAFTGKYSLAISKGMCTSRVNVDWRDVEPGPGVYDQSALETKLQDEQAMGLAPFVLIGTVDTGDVTDVPALPSDLHGLPMNDPEVIRRYCAMMDWAVPMIASYGGWCVAIGNEPRDYVADNPARLRELADFIAAVREHVHTLNANMPVTLTLNGQPDKWPVEFGTLLAECDVASVNFYGLVQDASFNFVKLDASEFIPEFRKIVHHCGSKLILVQELGQPAGYPDGSHKIQGLSQEDQRLFLETMAGELASNPQWVWANWFTQADWSQQLTDSITGGQQAGILGQLDEWLRSSGLCYLDWEPDHADGTPRLAWQAFLDSLDALYGAR